MSPLPDVGQVARQPARDDEHGVDQVIVAGAHVARRQPLGGDRDPAQPVAVEREGGGVDARTSLDLDERQDPAAAGDDIDLAARNPRPPGEDSPTAETKPPGGNGLGAAAAFLRPLALNRRESSSARA